MDTILLIGIFAVLLIIGVIGISFSYKKEQEKTQRQQKIAQYRYRANQALTILGNFSQVPIGKEARELLIFYGLLNLKKAHQVAPKDNILKKQISQIEQQMQSINQSTDNKPIRSPKEIEKLNRQINQISNLAKYLVKIRTAINEKANLVPTAIKRLTSLINELKIDAYIQLGKQAQVNGEIVACQQHFLSAKALIDQNGQNNSRISSLGEELQNIMQSNKKATNNPEDETSKAAKEERNNAIDEQVFGPKKKW
ncbi:MAG: hypothetical protein OEY19_03515 [Gammaproteobacteria bacterium]|nr:hypothetical protein [Gammaproteobacteria bacterium]MDH5629922.1 hypothetical protein [Gammaproteobacteria bacterium]